jgi:hypothetical protein
MNECVMRVMCVVWNVGRRWCGVEMVRWGLRNWILNVLDDYGG